MIQIISIGCIVASLITFAAVMVVNRNLRIVAAAREHEANLLGGISQQKAKDYEKTLEAKLEKLLAGTGLTLTVSEATIVVILLVTIPPLIALILGFDLSMAVLLIVPSLLLPYMLLKQKKQQSHKKFSEQLGNAMSLIAANVRGGATVQSAIAMVAKSAPEPLHAELLYLLSQLNQGVSLGEATHQLAVRNKSHDLEIFSSAITIQQDKGGEVASVISQVGETIRERSKLQAFIDARTASAKMQIKMFTYLPIIVLLGLMAVNEDARDFYLTTQGFIVIIIAMTMCFLARHIIKKWSDILEK